ncbi:hypothetical protein M501DRAFT_992078 [Patellaria atrata CBS 101060]|uniref:Uncharacterized protein n=1 Tax=Patellaria atrata CBS 101060 TaxID=1346257 RepID=A0A9P4SAL3_9PEZI|nr:hypothetical protein M501DRAFT_992078 [Patellaria atrata CBS 101060]
MPEMRTGQSAQFSNHSTSPPSVCTPSCQVNVAPISILEWFPVNFTTTITAAVVWYTIRPQLFETFTATDTEYLTLPSGFTLPATNSLGTVVTTISFGGERGASETVIAYPTGYTQYPNSYEWSGTLPTNIKNHSTCFTATDSIPLELPTPEVPTQTSFPERTDNGQLYTPYWRTVTQIGLNEIDFPELYPNEDALSLCSYDVTSSDPTPSPVVNAAYFYTDTFTTTITDDRIAHSESTETFIDLPTGPPPPYKTTTTRPPHHYTSRSKPSHTSETPTPIAAHQELTETAADLPTPANTGDPHLAHDEMTQTYIDLPSPRPIDQNPSPGPAEQNQSLSPGSAVQTERPVSSNQNGRNTDRPTGPQGRFTITRVDATALPINEGPHSSITNAPDTRPQFTATSAGFIGSEDLPPEVTGGSATANQQTNAVVITLTELDGDSTIISATPFEMTNAQGSFVLTTLLPSITTDSEGSTVVVYGSNTYRAPASGTFNVEPPLYTGGSARSRYIDKCLRALTFVLLTMLLI